MDTGAGNGATLFVAFAERNHLQGKYTPSLRTVTGRGVGGLLTGDIVTAANGVPMAAVTALLRADPGTKVRLRIRSPDKSERDGTVTLRELL